MFLDLSSVSAQSFETLKPGTYSAKVESAEVKDTKDGMGQFILLWLKITSAEAAGRKVNHRFNIKNKSAKAVEIGLQDLKAFTVASGVGDKLQSVTDLVGREVGIKTSIKKDDKGESAVIKGFIPTKPQTATSAPPAPKGF